MRLSWLTLIALVAELAPLPRFAPTLRKSLRSSFKASRTPLKIASSGALVLHQRKPTSALEFLVSGCFAFLMRARAHAR